MSIELSHEVLRRIVRLCEFGARPPVILALLPSAVDAEVRGIWETIHGYRPPRGPLAHKFRYFFASNTKKLHSAFLASAYLRLIEQGVFYVDAYIKSYELYLEQFPGQEISFDRAYHLIRSVASNDLRQVTCLACEAAYVIPRDWLINDKEHCPVCNLKHSHSNNHDHEKEEIRFAKAPSDIANIESLKRVYRLCQLGARPPSIKALIPNSSDTLIRSHWVNMHGQRPPQGPLPFKPEWYFLSYERRMQAAMVVSMYQLLIACEVQHVDAYIKTYEMYCDLFNDAIFNFDRAWQLIRHVTIKEIVTESCGCGSLYLRLRDDLARDSACPSCRISIKNFALSSKKSTHNEPHVQHNHLRLPDLGNKNGITPENPDLTE